MHPSAGSTVATRHGPRVNGWLGIVVLLAVTPGCGTTRVTNTQRTATEQLLVSDAIDQSISQLDFRVLAGKPVFLDSQYLGGSTDQGYVVSSLRQQLLACGCLLQEDRTKATYVVEARSGGIGTDLNQVLVGVPQMSLPSVLPGQPSLIPEIPFAKRTDQKGVAKIAVYAYNRRTGRCVWQSGVVQAESTSKDTWVLGAGPFRRGTIGEATEIAGQQIAIPLLSGKEGGKEEVASVVAVTQPAKWDESPVLSVDASRLTGELKTAEPSSVAKLAAPVTATVMTPVTSSPLAPVVPSAPSVESVGSGGSERKAATAPPKPSGEISAEPHLQPIRITGYKSVLGP